MSTGGSKEPVVRATTPFNPNNIIVGDKDPSTYVGTIMRQFLMGGKHVELRNRGYMGRRKLFAILETANASIPFSKVSLTTVTTKYTVTGSDEEKVGMDNTLVLDLATDIKGETVP